MSMNSFWGSPRIRETNITVTGNLGANRKANEALDTTRHLEERIDKLTLVCMAMWEIIRDKTTLEEADLMEKVQEIDLRDGVADGKATRTINKCAKCNRAMSPKHKRCLYCGHQELITSVFDGI